MTRCWAVAVTVLAALLAAYVTVERLGVGLLADPSSAVVAGGAVAATLGVGLLVIDAVLPVASSMVMVAHGAAFGVVGGTLLSLLGSTGGALLGFGLGRRGAPLVVRVVPVDQRARAERLLARWGGLAVTVSRPVPLLAETVAILAGASAMRWRSLAIAAAAGAFPTALAYALAGALAGGLRGMVLVGGLLLAGLVVGYGRRRAGSPSSSTPRPARGGRPHSPALASAGGRGGWPGGRTRA
ncbi:MAG: VTT domain-containing protein [Actinomycetota bacterium]|nr:VTT domain-containing protein [Actinomycetota bacterium]